MNDKSFNMEEFIAENTATPVDEEVSSEENVTPELDVQKAVVESLAADKAMLEREIEKIKEENARLHLQLESLSQRAEETKKYGEECEKRAKEAEEKTEIIRKELSRMQTELSVHIDREMDMQERNPNAIALLDRDVDIPDRFPGETRDHVLEVIAAARKEAEETGRVRRAQVLEGVLLSNEPNGTLAERRRNIEEVFSENGNIVSGPVIEYLQNLGISHKNGEDYLMPAEILKRNY